ncbi:hypothetical protein BDD14_3003 [Edaphobacter modestus]|uniref:Uncharacterized protein n=1 Tax=Edaphobacter modestus TaxID=388466 RepID=A0A4Q7YV07_9BACT|nr:hypothetical protein BDD14_3003 [Edaphobacter modestus]
MEFFSDTGYWLTVGKLYENSQCSIWLHTSKERSADSHIAASLRGDNEGVPTNEGIGLPSFLILGGYLRCALVPERKMFALGPVKSTIQT